MDLEQFIVTFINHLRRDSRIKAKPSVRQSFAIGQFLVSRFFRQNKIEVTDVIQAAYLTTNYEDQNIAKEIALDVLHSFLNAKMVDTNNPTYQGLIKVIEFNNYLQSYAKDEKVINDLFKVDYLNLNNLSDLVDIVFKNKKDSMTLKDLQYFATSGQLEKYLPEIKDKSQQIYAKQLLERNDYHDDLKELINHDISKFGETIKTLEKLGANSKDLDPIVQDALDQMQNIEQYEALTQQLNRSLPLPEHLKEHLTQKELLKHLKDQKSIASSSYLQVLKAKIEQSLPQDLNLEEILEGYRDTRDWQNFLTEMVSERMDQSSPSEKMEFLHQLQEKFPKTSNMSIQKEFLKEKMDLLKDLVESTNNSKELENLIKSLNADEISYDPSLIENKGIELNLDPKNLQKLLPAKVDQLKNMIHQNLDNFKQYSDFIQQFPLTPEEARDVLKTGVLEENSSVVGALGHQNLQQTIDQLNSIEGGKPIDLLMSGIAKGPGMNLLLQWFHSSKSIPTPFRQKIQEILQKTLIDISLFEVRTHFGFIKRGHLKECPELRIFMEGDSIENVAIEETIDNLIDQGKLANQIDESDILCRKEKEGQLKVLLVIDMSGSMTGEKITNAVLTCMILLQVLHSQEIAIVVFESDTRIIKDFDTPTDIDALSLDLLNLHAQGGTQISQSLNFMIKKIDEMESNQMLYTVILSDFGVYETEAELTPLLQKLQSGNLRLNLIATESPEPKTIALFKRFLNINLVSVESPQQIPQILSLLLSDIK